MDIVRIQRLSDDAFYNDKTGEFDKHGSLLNPNRRTRQLINRLQKHTSIFVHKGDIMARYVTHRPLVTHPIYRRTKEAATGRDAFIQWCMADLEVSYVLVFESYPKNTSPTRREEHDNAICAIGENNILRNSWPLLALKKDVTLEDIALFNAMLGIVGISLPKILDFQTGKVVNTD